MTILKIIGFAFVALCCYNLIKNAKPEFSVALIIGAGALILILLSDGIVESVTVFRNLTEKSGLNSSTFSSVIKIIGIGYVTEYSASVCEDGGSKSLAQKIQFAGKLTVFLLALPIVVNVFDVIEGML